MAEFKKTDGLVPFGSEEAEAVAAPDSVDALTVFLENAALPMIAALIVGGFLVFQFGRWLMNSETFGADAEDEMLRERAANATPAAQMPAETPFRPWKGK